MKKVSKQIFIVILALFASSFTINTNEFDEIISRIETKYSKVNDYTCYFSKNDFVGGEYFVEENVYYKHKKENFYYMKYTTGFMKNGEVIYAGKKYDNKLMVHLGGILNVKNLKLDPKGERAMKGNRHSILESDLGNLIEMVKKNYELAKKRKEGKFKYYKDEKVDNRDTKVYLAILPDNGLYYAHKIYLYIDEGYDLPVKLSVYDWDDKLLERFEIKKLKINPGLTSKDFDINNPNYNF